MTHQRRRGARIAAGLLAAVLALSIAPLAGTASAAAPLPPLANPLGAGNFCDGAPTTNPFTDLGSESTTTRQVILCLVATGLTTGTGTGTTYSPGDPVNRRQMALFISRLADLLEANEAPGVNLPELPAYDGTSDFSDVSAQDPGAAAIGRLAQANIVDGFGDGTYRPNSFVSRRQMATFIVNLFDFLGDPPTATADYFDDDNGDSGEANLNRLAAVGIFQGTSPGKVFPGADISRRQMANVILRTGQVFLDQGRVTSPFKGGETLTIAPKTVQAIVFAEGVNNTTPDDDRTYTATGLPASTTGYRVTLVDSDNIYTEGGTRRFAEDGNTGLADAGTVAARIVSVNGTAVDPGLQSVGGIQPVNGTITFTIDGNGIEAVTPVIYRDGGGNTRLEINDAGSPIEAFGVGGETQYIAPEADGPVNGTVALVGNGFAVVDGNLSDGTVYFETGDVYRLGGPPFETVTAAVFFQALSTGDGLRTCQADDPTGIVPGSYTAGEANTYCLTDDAPVSPDDVATAPGTPRDTTIDLTWSAVTPADAYNIYRVARSCSTTAVQDIVPASRIATVSARTTGYRATGLTADTTYCFVVTTVEDGDESEIEVGTAASGDDNTAQGVTFGPVDAPTITSAVLTNDAVAVGSLTEDDVITLTFNEAMDPTSVVGATFTVVDPDGDTTAIECVQNANPLPPQPTNGRTSATCALGNGSSATVANDTLVLTVVEDGDDATTAGGNDGLEYPLTITASTVLTDADDDQTVNVAASTDKTIS